ncbi:MAG: 7-cyano-7-deazaguanine synthase [Deltaproteobacteria bacterium]|nr:7-cyano-7-deazaguanine synthase [Deltaproteobacteria bacterium]
MNKKAVALLSGGLDSTLAVKVMLEQGIEIEALNFTSAFCTCNCRESTCRSEAQRVAKEFGIKIKVLQKGLDYVDVIRKPKYGYGQGINPCVDCRIYMHKLAKRYMEETGASFIITGEVLGQRPMSQRIDAFKSIEKESGLQGLILRPLSAKHLEPTIPENAGIVDREKLLDIIGRSRRPQMELAEDFNLENYPCPSGGCLLTDKIFSKKVRDLLEHNKNVTAKDLYILKAGRHFRINENAKVILGRDEKDNIKLKNLKQNEDILIEPLDFAGPTAIICGTADDDAVNTAGRMILRYAKEKANGNGQIKMTWGSETTIFTVDSPLDEKTIERMRIC